MKSSNVLVCIVAIAGCARARLAVAPANATGTPSATSTTLATSTPVSPPFDDASRDAFFRALEHNDEEAALAALARTPALADARTPKGTSAYFAALGRVVGNGFIRPNENRVAAAVLALRPTLDGFDAAAAGDITRVDAEIARDPAFVGRVHRIGWTALHFAAFGGQPRVVQLLLGHGAAVDAVARNHFANTPLQVGLLTGQGEVARLLLTHGANVNFRQSEGVTALHEAALTGDAAVVRMLLDAGADPNARTGKLDDGTEGLSPLDMARKANHASVVALLASRIAHD